MPRGASSSLMRPMAPHSRSETRLRSGSRAAGCLLEDARVGQESRMTLWGDGLPFLRTPPCGPPEYDRVSDKQGTYSAGNSGVGGSSGSHSRWAHCASGTRHSPPCLWGGTSMRHAETHGCHTALVVLRRSGRGQESVFGLSLYQDFGSQFFLPVPFCLRRSETHRSPSCPGGKLSDPPGRLRIGRRRQWIGFVQAA